MSLLISSASLTVGNVTASPISSDRTSRPRPQPRPSPTRSPGSPVDLRERIHLGLELEVRGHLLGELPGPSRLRDVDRFGAIGACRRPGRGSARPRTPGRRSRPRESRPYRARTSAAARERGHLAVADHPSRSSCSWISAWRSATRWRGPGEPRVVAERAAVAKRPCELIGAHHLTQLGAPGGDVERGHAATSFECSATTPARAAQVARIVCAIDRIARM